MILTMEEHIFLYAFVAPLLVGGGGRDVSWEVFHMKFFGPRSYGCNFQTDQGQKGPSLSQ